MMINVATTISLRFCRPLDKGDAKTWFNSLDLSYVRSPQDMIYYFFAKYFPEVGGQAVLGRQQWAPTPWLTERHGYDPT